MANIEYNYIYEDGRITRAAQSTITMSGENVTSKTLDFAIHYVYDKDGKLTLKYTSEDPMFTGGNYYEYDKNDGTWKDLLTAYNGQSITYDAQGNPTSYLGHTLTWEKGRQAQEL